MHPSRPAFSPKLTAHMSSQIPHARKPTSAQRPLCNVYYSTRQGLRRRVSQYILVRLSFSSSSWHAETQFSRSSPFFESQNSTLSSSWSKWSRIRRAEKYLSPLSVQRTGISSSFPGFPVISFLKSSMVYLTSTTTLVFYFKSASIKMFIIRSAPNILSLPNIYLHQNIKINYIPHSINSTIQRSKRSM